MTVVAALRVLVETKVGNLVNHGVVILDIAYTLAGSSSLLPCDPCSPAAPLIRDNGGRRTFADQSGIGSRACPATCKLRRTVVPLCVAADARVIAKLRRAVRCRPYSASQSLKNIG